MKLLVLAGGFGTRLRSVVAEIPKALAPVGEESFLHFQIENWKNQGLKSFVFLLHYQAELIIDFLKNEKDGLLKDCEVQWLVEPTPMDTGGSLAYAVEELDIAGDFLVINADTWLGAGVNEVWQAGSPAIAVVKIKDTGRYGSVRFDDECKILSFHEKSSFTGAGWINAGLCHLHAELFKSWNHEPFSLERDRFFIWANLGILKAVPLNSDFIDIGIPDEYFRFCRWIESQKTKSL
jgi:D-glycero-alpha-D-manno-heptose 1-phosphate guanylyltransferase